MRNDIQLRNWHICGQFTDADAFAESIFFTGNGRMGTRGYNSSSVHGRPAEAGLFIAGIFDEIKPGITDFVNLPTPFCENITIDGEKTTITGPVSYDLDLSCGLLTLNYRIKRLQVSDTAPKKSLSITHRRFLSMNQTSLALQELSLTPSDSMKVSVLSGVYLDSCNCPVPDDQVKENKETVQLTTLKELKTQKSGFSILLETTTTKHTIHQKLSFQSCGFSPDAKQEYVNGIIGLRFEASLSAKETIRLEKASEIHTSRDRDPLITPLPPFWSFKNLLNEQKKHFESIWKQCAIRLTGDEQAQTALRYCQYQLIVNCSRNDDTVNIGARGLTHTRYKGCYFWDTDMFMMPYYLFTEPNTARNLMQYRINTLPQAKEHAKKMNGKGARYPWMVSLSGEEQCESWDIGASELHITADVVFALDQYISTTNDMAFYKAAAEVYIETARFWMSRYTWDSASHKANLLFCKGPDEYCGITNNNLYTNYFVKHNLKLAETAARHMKEHMPDVYKQLELSENEILHWEDLRRSIPLPKNPQNGHWQTDETFHLLEPVDIKFLKPNDEASYHQICFDRLQRYKVIKQADVLLLMSRFPQNFSEEEKLQAWNDYEPICLHDSTLSFASHALFAAQNGLLDSAIRYFNKAVYLDLKEIMNNTGKEGLHLACFGETWQTVVFGFAGLRFNETSPELHPHLPPEWTLLEFPFVWKGISYRASITQTSFQISTQE